MENEVKSVPVQTFKRLPDYYNLLVKLDVNGIENVSSTMIAEAFGVHDIVYTENMARSLSLLSKHLAEAGQGRA